MKNRYSFSETISNVYAFLLTKLFYRPARLIRRPIYCRGKKSISIGKDLVTGHSCRFDLLSKKKTLFIGKGCQFGDYTHIVASESVEIGDNVLLASKVFISDTEHGTYKGKEQCSPNIPPVERELIFAPVKIGNNVWIGENSVVLSGSIIGNGVIVGANSLVKGVIPSNCVVAGSPAKIIKKWNPEKNEWIRVG